jgi:hypothetical protein
LTRTQRGILGASSSFSSRRARRFPGAFCLATLRRCVQLSIASFSDTNRRKVRCRSTLHETVPYFGCSFVYVLDTFSSTSSENRSTILLFPFLGLVCVLPFCENRARDVASVAEHDPRPSSRDGYFLKMTRVYERNASSSCKISETFSPTTPS